MEKCFKILERREGKSSPIRDILLIAFQSAC